MDEPHHEQGMGIQLGPSVHSSFSFILFTYIILPSSTAKAMNFGGRETRDPWDHQCRLCDQHVSAMCLCASHNQSFRGSFIGPLGSGCFGFKDGLHPIPGLLGVPFAQGQRFDNTTEGTTNVCLVALLPLPDKDLSSGWVAR